MYVICKCCVQKIKTIIIEEVESLLAVCIVNQSTRVTEEQVNCEITESMKSISKRHAQVVNVMYQ